LTLSDFEESFCCCCSSLLWDFRVVGFWTVSLSPSSVLFALLARILTPLPLVLRFTTLAGLKLSSEAFMVVTEEAFSFCRDSEEAFLPIPGEVFGLRFSGLANDDFLEGLIVEPCCCN